MLYIEDGKWALCPYKVIYEQHGEALEQYTHDKNWWNDFADKWEHTEIIEFKEVEYTTEQKDRLKEISHLGEGFGYLASQYVLNGSFPDELEDEERLDNHPLQNLQRKKENEDLGQMGTKSELEDMDQGQKLTDLELQMMAKKEEK